MARANGKESGAYIIGFWGLGFEVRLSTRERERGLVVSREWKMSRTNKWSMKLEFRAFTHSQSLYRPFPCG